MPLSGYRFYTKPEYYADIIARINAAQPGDRVITATMAFEAAHPDTTPLIDAFIAAAERGVKVTLLVDAYAFLSQGAGSLGPLFYHRRLPRRMSEPYQSNRDALERLAAAGGRYFITNQPSHPFSVPVAGRSHIKFTVIENQCYIGGTNLEGFDRLDFMVGWLSSAVSDWLSALTEKLIATANAHTALGGQDISFTDGPKATIFADAGVRDQSLIMDQGLSLINEATERVFIACQFFPGDITARTLVSAHRRGVKVNIVYNHVSKFDQPMSLVHYALVRAERMRRPASFFEHANRGPGYLHAKLIATEHGAIVGSHNFVRAGVTLGTAEIALLVRDRQFADEAIQTVMRQLPELGQL
jgi:cardiolipin synthase